MAEAGWYHVEGDPPGTVRRWNGAEWIGFAVADPSDPDAVRRNAHPKSYLSKRGSTMSGLTVVSFTGLAVVFSLFAAQVYRGIDALPVNSIGPPIGTDVPIRTLDRYVDWLVVLLGLSAVIVAVAAVAFTMWSREAAAVAQTHRFARASNRSRRFERSARREMREPTQVRGLYSLVAAVLGGVVSGGSTTSHADLNLFGRVSDTAMAASSDTATGVSTISPIKIIVWWVLLWLPLLIGGLAWFLVALMGPVSAETMQSMLELTVVLLLLEVVSLLCIILTVGQITSNLSQ